MPLDAIDIGADITFALDLKFPIIQLGHIKKSLFIKTIKRKDQERKISAYLFIGIVGKIIATLCPLIFHLHCAGSHSSHPFHAVIISKILS